MIGSHDSEVKISSSRWLDVWLEKLEGRFWVEKDVDRTRGFENSNGWLKWFAITAL